MKETVEREVKLVPPEGFSLLELGGQVLPTRTFLSTYHDTADLRLARHGITFRHRMEDGAGVWQLKLPRAESRLELEQAGPPAVPPPELLALLPALLRAEQLVAVARLRTRRHVVRVDGAEIVDDSVAVLERQRIARRFRELEIELTDGDARTLRRLEKALRGAGAAERIVRPKLYEALELASPTVPVVSKRATPAEALAIRLREQATQLLAHDPGTRIGSDPEDLHQLRVATRRLRAFLRSTRPLLEPEPTEGLRAELAWLGAALGPARDLDVLLELFRGEIAALGSEGAAAAGLLGVLEERRDVARTTLLDALGSERYFALLDRLERFAEAPPPGGAGSKGLAAIWWGEVKALRRASGRLGDAPSDGKLHEVRILAKRARYAAELAAHELGHAGAVFVDRAKAAQDVLGAHQDACVADEHVRAWASGQAERDAVAVRLLERQRARKAEARAAWPETWTRLERAARRARR